MTPAKATPSVTVRGRKSVLVVDPDPQARLALRRALEERFKEFAYYESGDGKDAFQKISRQKYEWVITDLKLPKLDGKGLIEALANLSRDVLPTHILIRDENWTADGSVPHPIVTFVPKSPDFEEILNRVAEGQTAAPRSPSAAASRLDLTVVHAAIESLTSAFPLLAGVPLKRDRTSVSRESQLRGDIGAQTRFEREGASVETVLSMLENCYVPIASKVSGQPAASLAKAGSKFMEDLGERTFKGIAERLGQKGRVAFEPATILKGSQGVLTQWGAGVRVSTQFQSSFGLVTVRLDLRF